MVTHPNLDHLVLAGDLNSRLATDVDEDETHIGPAVIGQRQSIQDETRDNAIYLYDTLQAHSLRLPQTFAQLPFSKRCTYKEMSCEDHLLRGTSVSDWTALDYAAAPQLREVLTIYGTFQQLINTRHLPLSCGIKTQFYPSVTSSTPPKKDYSDLAQFSDAVETALLKETNSFYSLLFDNPAGWGFAVTLVNVDQHPPPSSSWAWPCCI